MAFRDLDPGTSPPLSYRGELPSTTMKLKPNLSRRDGSDGEEGKQEYYVLGGGHLGEWVARRLQSAGHSVTLIDETRDPAEIDGEQGDPRDVQVLADAGLSSASRVVVATPRDSRNMLIAQLVRTHFEVPEVIVLVNTPERCTLVAEAGHEPVCATSALSDALVDNLEQRERGLDQTA